MSHDESRKDTIRRELLRCARARRTITYGELGKIVGIPPQGPWKPVLDEIGREEAAEGRPDISYLVVTKKTRLPGQIALSRAHPPTARQRQEAEAAISEVFEFYRRRENLK